eukprot:c26039_g1_i1 orf=3-224(-)
MLCIVKISHTLVTIIGSVLQLYTQQKNGNKILKNRERNLNMKKNKLCRANTQPHPCTLTSTCTHIHRGERKKER